MSDSNPGSAPATSSTPAPPPSPSLEVRVFDAETVALCIQALQQFRAGLSQALLYTLEARQFEKYAIQSHQALFKLLEKIGPFTMAVSNHEVLFNGTRIEIPSGLRIIVEYVEKLMSAAGLHSLKFEKDLTAAETGLFLQLLARKKFVSTDGAKINQFLHEQQILHIQTEELRYVAMGAHEKVVASVLGGMANHSVAQTAIEEVCDAFVQTIKPIQDDEARQQLRAEIVDQLIQKDNAMLENILSTGAQRLKDPANVQYQDLMALPFRDGALINQVLLLGKALQEREPLGEGPFRDRLKAMIEQLSSPYKLRAEDLLGLVKFDPALQFLLPEWLVLSFIALQSGSALNRLDGILTQSPHALLDEAMFQQIVDVLDELSVAGLDAEAQRLTTHIAGALHCVTKVERMKAVERLSGLLDRSMEQISEAVRSVENALLDACTHETCDEVLVLLLDHLARRCVHHYSLKNYERASTHLDWIASLEESSRVALRDEGANLARKKREELAHCEWGRMLAADMLESDPKGTAARHMIGVLGSEVWNWVLQRMRTESEPQAAQLLAQQFKLFGSQAVQMFYAALNNEPEGAIATRLFSLAPEVGDNEVLWKSIPQLLNHPDWEMRASVIHYLSTCDEPRSVYILAEKLRAETNLSQRTHLLKALTGLRNENVLSALLAELQEEHSSPTPRDECLIELLHVLENFDQPSIVSAVVPLLSSVRGGRALLPGRSEQGLGSSKPVVLAAIKVLAHFYTQPPVIEALERARKEKDPEISRMALVSLRGIVESEKSHGTERVTESPVLDRPLDLDLETNSIAVAESDKPISPATMSTLLMVTPKIPPIAPLETANAPGVETPHTPSGILRASNLPRKIKRFENMAEPNAVTDSVASMPTPSLDSAVLAVPAPTALPAAQLSIPAPSSPPVPTAKLVSQVFTPASGSGSGLHYTQPAASSNQRLAAMNSFSAAEKPAATETSIIRALPSLKDLKASLEGSLLGVGLLNTLKMLCKSDGVLRLESKGLEGRIYIKSRKVVYACYGKKIGLDALSEMETCKAATFAYFQKIPPPETTLNVDVLQLLACIEKFRDENNKKSYY